MNRNFLFALMLVSLCLASCKKENQNDGKSQGSIQFGLSQPEQQLNIKSSNANLVPSAVVITIADAQGNVILESQKIVLFNMNGSYLSDPLSLTTGNYSITKFIILNSSDSAIYATPLKDSRLAYLVDNPLPIAFNIAKDIVTKISPEVIATENLKFEDFGYDSFSFDIVKTFHFLAMVAIYNESALTWDLSTANITIKTAENTLAYSGRLEAITNQITLRDNSSSFSITVSKDGYQTYNATITATELKLYFRSEDKGPLNIKLFSESTIVTDIEGNIYHTVRIGNQVWMVENLKVTKFRNGEDIPRGPDVAEQWRLLNSPAYSWELVAPDETTIVNTYGRLYNWYAVADSRNICPEGWHVPTDAEWDVLTDYLGGESVAGGKMKTTGSMETGDGLWGSPNEGGSNESGFSALPGGGRTAYGTFTLGFSCWWWSATEKDANAAWSRGIDYAASVIVHNWTGDPKTFGFSVRCIKDSYPGGK